LYRLREEGGVTVFGEPKARWGGLIMGYLIVLAVGAGLVRSMARSSGTLSLVFHGAGLAFLAAFVVGWTRQGFSRFELRIDPVARRMVQLWTPFLGRASRQEIDAHEVAEIRLEQRGTWTVGLVMKDGSLVTLDAAKDGDGPLRTLAESLERGLGLPLVVSEEKAA
jgi:hypothetical protein